MPVREESGLLALSSAAHFLVDALCAAVIFGQIKEGRGALLLLYNTLAFSTQCFTGLLSDHLEKPGRMAAFSMFLTAAGWFLPVPSLLKVCLTGMGNSCFHVAGGVITLRRSGGKAWPLGIFVSPGAAGLLLGTLMPSLGSLFAAGLAAGGLLFLVSAGKTSGEAARDSAGGRKPSGIPGAELLIPLLLTMAVSVRAIGGTAVVFPWKRGLMMTVLMTAAVFAGKAAGGFVCDALGPMKTAVLSILPAAVLTAFCSGSPGLSLLGQFALNLTMPVTLLLLYRSLPENPGFAFGLAAAALWPGDFWF